MPRFSRLLPAAFAAGAALLQPHAAAAATSSEELWAEVAAKGDIGPDTDLKLEIEQRRRDGPNEWIVGAEVNHDVGGFKIGGGMEVHEIDGFTEVRPYQQVTFATGPLDFRTRLEERFYDDSDQLALRLRQRARVQLPVGTATKAFGSAELLYQLQDRIEDGPQRIDQWRFNAGLVHRVGDIELSGGYLFQIRPRDGGATRHTHVAQVGAAYRF